MNRFLAMLFALGAVTLYGCPDDNPADPDSGSRDGGTTRDAQPEDALPAMMDATSEDDAAAEEDATTTTDAMTTDAIVDADAGARPCPTGHPRTMAAEMSVLPSAEPMMWRPEGNLGEKSAVTNNMDGTITIRDMYADQLLFHSYQGEGCPTAAGDSVTIEWRTNAVSASPDPYGIVMIYVEPSRIFSVAMHPTDVLFYDNPTGTPIGQPYTITTGFHEYRLERQYPADMEGTISLYVDNVLALTQTATSFPNVASSGGTVTFGARGGFSTSEAVWDYVRYAVP